MTSLESDMREFLDGHMDVALVVDAHEPKHIGRWMSTVSDVDSSTIVANLYSLADRYIAERKYDNGLIMIDTFLSSGENNPEVEAEAWLLGSEFHAYRSRFEEALKYLENARAIFAIAGITEKLLRIHTDAAGFQKRLGDFGRARGEAEAGLELAASGDYSKWEMRLWNNLGLILKDIGDYSGAIDALRKSVELAKVIDSPRVIAAGLVNIGTLYHRIDRNKQAIEFMHRAKDSWEKIGDGHEVARCLNNLANYTRGDDPKQAAVFLDDALKRSRADGYADVEMTVHFNLGLIAASEERFDDAREEFRLSRISAETLGDDEYIWRSGRELGRIALDEGNAEDAKLILIRAAEVLSDTRRKLTSDTDRVSYLADRETLFADLVEADLAMDDPMAAISDIQRVKAVGLYELMTGRDVPAINEDGLKRLASDFGRRGIVAADYFRIDGKLIIGLLSAEGVEIREAVFDDAAFEKSLGAVRDKVKAYEVSKELRSRPVNRDSNLEAELEKLYEMIIGPIGDRLDGAVHLVIIPHSPVVSLPFASLKGPVGYIVERCSISIYPNLSVAGKLIELDAKEISGFSMAYVHGQSGDLEALDAEAEAVKRMFPGTVREASADGLESLASAGGDWLHYSGHAVFAEDAGPEPAIELGDGRRIPFSMSGDDIPVVAMLSACQAGLGTMRGSTEMLGFARRMFAGGGRALIAPLWQVADRETAGFVADFYKSLATSGSAASALAAAQRESILDGRHPYFWAGFTCSGDVAFK